MFSPSSKLGRKPAQRKALIRNLVTSLVLYESIRTTKARAKAIRPIIDRMIVKAKSAEPHVAIRYLNSILTDKNACRKMMEVLIKRYEKRQSGFTRTKPLGFRVGDGADLVEISLLDS